MIILLAFYEKVLRHFRRIAIVTRLLPSRDSEITGAIVRIAILKRPVNKLFAVENSYDTNQTDKASYKEIKEIPCCPVNHEQSCKKTQIEKKGNSTLQHLRTDFRSMMGEEHLNTLSLVHIHRYTFFDYDKITDTKHPSIQGGCF